MITLLRLGRQTRLEVQLGSDLRPSFHQHQQTRESGEEIALGPGISVSRLVESERESHNTQTGQGNRAGRLNLFHFVKIEAFVSECYG